MLRTLILVFALSLAVPLLAGAQTSKPQEKSPPWYLKSASASTYAKATAHAPNIADRALWNDDARKSAYAKQEWPKTRVLVWANPGASAKDGWEAKHWLENGKPATTPFDSECDLVFPDVQNGQYYVSLTDGRKYQPASFRHLTLGRGACIIGHFATRGNVWIKAGGSVRYMDSSLGSEHTFFRNDSAEGLALVDHFYVRKAPEASVEFIGFFTADDRWQFDSGMAVVAPGSGIGMGNRTDPLIGKNAAVAILSGAYLTRRSNCDWGNDLTVEGRLMAGLPERPLTHDANLGLGWKSKGQFFPDSRGGGRMPGPNDMGMRLRPEGSLTVYSADPAKARLVINCAKRDNDWGQIEIISRNSPLHGEPMIAKLKELPRRTDVELLGTVTWQGLHFDDLRKGGLVLPDPNLAATWRTVTFGPNNEGPLKDLLRAADAP